MLVLSVVSRVTPVSSFEPKMVCSRAHPLEDQKQAGTCNHVHVYSKSKMVAATRDADEQRRPSRRWSGWCRSGRRAEVGPPDTTTPAVRRRPGRPHPSRSGASAYGDPARPTPGPQADRHFRR